MKTRNKWQGHSQRHGASVAFEHNYDFLTVLRCKSCGQIVVSESRSEHETEHEGRE
jgi:hypothetical protein